MAAAPFQKKTNTDDVSKIKNPGPKTRLWFTHKKGCFSDSRTS
jgi:hypothetical protein